MSKYDTFESTPNTVDYVNQGDYPSDPDTLNYNYDTATYNEPRPIESNYIKTNYDITNYPRTDYNKFDANLTNYMNHDYESSNEIPLKMTICESPDMLYQVPKDPQSDSPNKYICFNTKDKLIEITSNKVKNLTRSKKHIMWQGAQCKINTKKCSKDDLTENCEATCYVSPTYAFTLKYKNNIWRNLDLEKNAGSCTMTAISDETAQNSYCKCDNVLSRPNLMTSANMDKDRTGRFWCSSN
jgi:hypothetical protein